MKKVMMYAVIAAVVAASFVLGTRYVSHTTSEYEAVAAVTAEVMPAPAKSVQEFAKQYEAKEMAPAERRLVEEGFRIDQTHKVTIQK